MTAEIFKTELLKRLAFVCVFFAGLVQADEIAIVGGKIVYTDGSLPH